MPTHPLCRYLLERRPVAQPSATDDDAAEAGRPLDSRDNPDGNRKRARGQNKARKFHWANDEVKLCQSLSHVPRESLFATTPCDYAERAGGDARGGNARGGRGGRRGGRNRNQEREEAAKADAPVEGEAKPEGEAKAEDGPPAAKELPRCAFAHDLREYLQHKAADIEGVCPSFAVRGYCARFVVPRERVGGADGV